MFLMQSRGGMSSSGVKQAVLSSRIHKFEPWGHLNPGVKLCSAAHNAVGLAGESPVVGIDCLPT